ncbi:MAG TPA: hypothetical protein PKW37_04335 [Salinivirgaceae bacterium]|nr:hypothetical protein [Salinivirgaceae bacterium]
MIITDIYTSKKLESLIPESLIVNESSDLFNPLGKWYATVFFISRKKCLLITNSNTKYSVIIAGINKPDFKNLSKIFTNTLIDQLKIDAIPFEETVIKNLIGTIVLHKTDNNRPIIGTQNHMLENIEVWKYRFGAFENWNFRKINRNLNKIPYKEGNLYLTPIEKMKSLLDEINTSSQHTV